VVTWWPLLVLAGVLALAGAVLLLRGERTAVYWLWAVDGRLLYIGMTNDVERRMEQHAADKSWWPQVASRTVRWYRSRPVAERAEEAAIRRDRPYFNDRHNRDNPHRVIVSRRVRHGDQYQRDAGVRLHLGRRS
jgi:predicted GIY-YIG superfamily endonuclease